MRADLDDRDHIWRQAAEGFPLNTGSADWSKVAEKLGQVEEPPPPPASVRNRGRYRWLLLLLLVPFLCMIVRQQGEEAPAGRQATADVQQSGGHPRAAAESSKEEHTASVSATKPGDSGAAAASAPPSGQPAGKQSLQAGSLTGPADMDPAAPAGAGTRPGSGSLPDQASGVSKATADRTGSVAGTATSVTSVSTTVAGAPPASVTRLPAVKDRLKKDRRQEPMATRQGLTGSSTAGTAGAAITARSGVRATPGASENTALRGAGSRSTTKEKRPATGSPDKVETSTTTGSGNDPRTTASPVAGKDGSASPDPAQPAAATETQKPAATDTSAKAAETSLVPKPGTPAAAAKTPSRKSGRFYGGLLAGAGGTTIRMQPVRHPGVDGGIVLGYRIGPRLAVEGGVLYSRKHYYARGSDLKIDVYVPRGSILESVSGDCRMIEIPLSLYYHFRGRRKGNWFAGAGVSSYLMQREGYSYNYVNTFSGDTEKFDTVYQRATRDWVSVLQLSGGYRMHLLRQLDLRLEPYVQLPLKPAGFGRLPLTSAGLRVVLSRNLF